MKRLSGRDLHIVILGVAFVALGGYVAVSRSSTYATDMTGQAPESEGHAPRSIAEASANLGVQGLSANVNMLGITAQGGFTPQTKLLHFFDPDTPVPPNPPNQQYTDSRHRYPTVSGTNISTLIHHGYSPMMCPNPRDGQWMVNPPSESYFGG